MTDPLPPRPLLVDLYTRLLRTRLFEEAVYNLFLTETMPGTVHLSTGQEAVSAGVCAHLRPDDFVVPSFRGHGEYLAKGGNLRAAMAEIFARATGCCGGVSGSMHLNDVSAGIIPGIAIVGAGIPIAAGLALAARLRKSDQVAVAFFGDGASNCGYFHEGLNLAAVWRLPAVFICANNLYGVSTPFDRTTLADNVAERASAYHIPAQRLDGNDVLAVYQAAGVAVAAARRGEGPTLLECMTYRFHGHSRAEPGRYRPQGELDEWLARDPLPRFKAVVLESQPDMAADLADVERVIQLEVAEAVEFARVSPEPDPAAVLRTIFLPLASDLSQRGSSRRSQHV